MLRVTFTLVQVDAVVTDSAGRRVVDLKPTDFEVRQDGVRDVLSGAMGTICSSWIRLTQPAAALAVIPQWR